MKKSKRLLSLFMAAAMAASMTAVPAFAATDFNFTYPSSVMDVNSTTGTGGSRYLTTLAQRASSEIPLVFGINVVGGNVFDGLRTMAGTSVSENPDPYMWNFNYLYPDYKRMTDPGEKRAGAENLPQESYYQYMGNGLTNANGLYNSGGANQVYANPFDNMGGTGYAVGKRVDVMIGFNSALVDQIDMVRSWKNGDEFYRTGDESYSPLVVDVQTGSVTSRLYSWMDMAQGIQAYLKDHPEFAVRYGDPVTIAANLEEFSAGIPYYIASLIDKGQIEKKTMAYVYNVDGATYNCVNPRKSGDVSADVYGEVNNFDFLEGSLTLKEIMDKGADIIVLGQSGYAYTGGSIGRDVVSAASSTTKLDVLKALVALGFKADQMPLVIDGTTRNVTFGGQGYNYAPTTPMYMTFIQAYCYMEELAKINPAINPVALYQYMYDEFGHVNDSSAADVALYNLGNNWDSVDPDFDKVPSLTDYVYNKSAINNAIRDGVAYALSGRAEANGNTLVPAIREGENAYKILTEHLSDTAPAAGHESIQLTVNGKTQYLDLTALAEFDDGSKSSTGDGGNAAQGSSFSNTRTSFQAIIDYYNGSDYGYGDDLQTTLQNYADHMVEHVWKPATDIAGSIAEGIRGDNSGFTDVAATDWFNDAVSFVFTRGIMNGMSDSIFAPVSNLRRCEIVQMLYNMEGDVDGQSEPFADVSDDAWYAKAVAWAYTTGVVNGMSDTSFAPEANCTREQVAQIVFNYAKYKNLNTSPTTELTAFTDASSVSGWAMEAMKWANACQVINGYPDSTLKPLNNITRAEMAQLVTNYLRSAA